MSYFSDEHLEMEEDLAKHGGFEADMEPDYGDYAGCSGKFSIGYIDNISGESETITVLAGSSMAARNEVEKNDCLVTHIHEV
jgi:hypothetical protein